jgi:transposase
VVFDWHKYFREGNTSITDKEGRGRKKKVTTTLVTLVANVLENDRRLAVKALMAKFDVSYGTCRIFLQGI